MYRKTVLKDQKKYTDKLTWSVLIKNTFLSWIPETRMITPLSPSFLSLLLLCLSTCLFVCLSACCLSVCLIALVHQFLQLPQSSFAGVEGDICYSQTDFEICKYGCCGINQSYCCDLKWVDILWFFSLYLLHLSPLLNLPTIPAGGDDNFFQQKFCQCSPEEQFKVLETCSARSPRPVGWARRPLLVHSPLMEGKTAIVKRR